MTINTRFIIALLSLAAIVYHAFHPTPQPWNALIGTVLGGIVGWAGMSLYLESQRKTK